MGQFIGVIKLTPLDTDNGRNWRVDSAFDYRADNGDTVYIPAGEVTDLASIPRLFWTFWPPEGLWTDAAIVHDTAYAQKIFSRLRCDQILLEAMKDKGVGWFSRWAIYSGVRIDGWMAWNKYKK